MSDLAIAGARAALMKTAYQSVSKPTGSATPITTSSAPVSTGSAPPVTTSSAPIPTGSATPTTTASAPVPTASATPTTSSADRAARERLLDAMSGPQSQVGGAGSGSLTPQQVRQAIQEREQQLNKLKAEGAKALQDMHRAKFERARKADEKFSSLIRS